MLDSSLESTLLPGSKCLQSHVPEMHSRTCTLVLDLMPGRSTLLPGSDCLQACHIRGPECWAEQSILLAVQVGLLTMLSLTLRASPAAAVVASEQLLQAGKRFTSPARLPLLLWALNQAARWGPCRVQQDMLPFCLLALLLQGSACGMPTALQAGHSAAAAHAGPHQMQLHCWQGSSVAPLSRKHLTRLYAGAK